NRIRTQLQASSPGEQYSIRPVDQPKDAARYDILLEPLATSTLFGPYQVRAISGRLQGMETDNDDSIYLRFPLARRIQYQVLSEIPDRSLILPAASREEAIPSDIARTYLQLP